MTSLEELKQLINYIHRRLPDEEKIDAAEHNRILKTLVDSLAGIGANVFLGVATPETIPEQSPATKCFYLATKKGNYPHFGDLTINSPLAVIYWNGFDWEKHEIEVSVNVNVDIDDYVDLSNYAKLTADNEFVGNQKIIGSLETGETRGKLRPVANRNRKMTDGEAVVWDALLQVIKTVKQVPDSVLWNSHVFKDYLDQALRTTDSPEFVSLLASYLKSKDFVSGLSGYKVGEDTEVETLKVRRFLEVVEYLVNQISLIGDEVILTEGGEIDSVEILENGYYKCELREESVRAGELKVGDICMTDFKLENGFRKIYFEITKVGNDNTIEVYPEDPAYPPQPLMTFRRRGNFTDETRQNSIRLSSHDQIIEMLSGVNSYDVTWKNRDILIGKIKDLIPEIKGLPERARQKATFFGQNMVLLGNVFQVSADGVTQERVPCYKGLWTIEKAPFFYYDQVTDGYCRYTCVHEGEDGTMEAPRFDSSVWQVADGDTTLRMEMYSSTGSWEFWDRLDILFDVSTEVLAGNKPINDLVNEWEWWIETGDEDFDASWKSLHGSKTSTQHVDGSTFPTSMETGIPVKLWCKARIYNNGKTNTSEGYLNLQ